MRSGFDILTDEAGNIAFDVYSGDGELTGQRMSYLVAERNGQTFTWGFNPDGPRALDKAIADFGQFLDLNGGKEVCDA